jgi:hypothetical protein
MGAILFRQAAGEREKGEVVRYGSQKSPADANAPGIYKDLRAAGWRVAPVGCADDTSRGVPDAIVARALIGLNHLVEVKMPGRFLNDNQLKFSRSWPGCIHVAATNFQALAQLEECESGWRRA